MNDYKSQFFSFRLWAGILGGLLVTVFGGVYFFNVSANVSAQTEDVEKQTAEQNLVNGKLAFTRTLFGPTSPDGRIIIANPDGSGGVWLATPAEEDITEPAWSPDGNRLVFTSRQQNQDIYVINANGSGVLNLTNTGFSTRESNPSWSVTGKIAFVQTNSTGGDAQIWVVNPDGTGNAQFPGITQPFPNAPSWSPDGTKLAFVSGSEIWVINADGTNEQRVTNNSTTDTDPAWSPDGLKIVFKKGNDIAIINADGTNEMIVATSGSAPAWSPDGTKIAFSRDGIYTMDANGSNQVRIVANTTNFPNCCATVYENPAWQPVAQTPNTFNINGRVSNNNLPVSGVTVNLSGSVKASATTDAVGNYQFSGLPEGGSYTVSPSFRRHYFTPPNRSFNNLSSNQTGNFEVLGVCYFGKCVKNGKIAFTRSGDIFTINTDGTNETNITNNAATDSDPKWSPDGANIIFHTNRDGNYEIYRMNADGSNPVRLTDNAASDASPYYSPDGASIVFASFRDGNYEIYKMNADGSNPVRLTNNPAPDSEPAFSPDGQKITYIEYGSAPGIRPKVYTINADGSNPQQIPVPSGSSASGYVHLSYSPDGSKLMFTYSSDTQSFGIGNTWTMNADGTNPAQLHIGRFGTYSPDGAKVAYICCQFDSSNRLRTSNLNGSSEMILTSVPSSSSTFVYVPDWQPIPAPHPAPFDFDGDGRSDISVFRPSNSGWYLLRSTEGLWVPQWGLSSDVLAPADYDGDMKTDVAVWRPSDGNFYILNSFNNTVRIENFGLDGDIPTGGDWDGDGKADLAVYSGANGTFYYRGSMGNPNGNVTFILWGVSGDKPVAGDFDGDGRMDAAVYRSGIWYILNSSSGQLTAYQFGVETDKIIPADYDADGKTDPAVYRDGIWYLLRSVQGFTAFQFGISGDVPAPADYDGDGRADAAVYRDGVWWILNSQSGTAGAVSFGLDSDAPIPSAFVR